MRAVIRYRKPCSEALGLYRSQLGHVFPVRVRGPRFPLVLRKRRGTASI